MTYTTIKPFIIRLLNQFFDNSVAENMEHQTLWDLG